MTPAEIRAHNVGIYAVLDVARRAVEALRDEPSWKPTREGAIDALDELATAGTALLIDDPDAPTGVLARLSWGPQGGCQPALAGSGWDSPPG